MKKLLKFWPYLILSLILCGYFLLALKSPINYASILVASFLIFYFLMSASLIGSGWALISTFLLTFSNAILNASLGRPMILLAPLSIILAVEFFLFYVRKPNNLNLLFSGILIGLAMALSVEAWVILPLALSLIIILALAKLGREWQEIDPAMRRHKIQILIAQNLKIISSLILVAIATLYIFFTIYWFIGLRPSSSSTLTNWLLSNIAFRPFGLYSLMFENKNLSALTIKESIPLDIFICFGLLLYIIRLAKSFFTSFFIKLNLVNYLGVYEREFFYTIFVTVFGVLNFSSSNPNLIAMILLTYLILLAVLSIKSWFTIFDANLTRNVLVRILIFRNHLFALSLKTGALALILIWHLSSAIYNFL